MPEDIGSPSGTSTAMTAEAAADGGLARGTAAGLRWLPVGLVWLVAFAALGVAKGASFGFFGATYACLALVAILSPVAGVWIALTAATYDRYFYLRNWEHQEWFPPQVHIVDIVAVLLAAGFLIRLATHRSRLRWQWWDTLYTVFFAFVVIAAAHGVLARYEAVMRVGRIVPALGLYYPVRELAARTSPAAVNRAMLGYGTALSMLAGVLAWLASPLLANRSDILLPRLLYVTNITPMLILPAVAWPAFVAAIRYREQLLTAGVLMVTGAARAIDNTRSAMGTVVVGALALLWMAPRVTPRGRAVALARAAVAVALVAAGFCAVHGIRLAKERARWRWAQDVLVVAPPDSQAAKSARTVYAPRELGDATRFDVAYLQGDSNLLNRLFEYRFVLSVPAAQLLVGRGLGAPVRYEGLDWKGDPMEVNWWHLHNGYLFFLYTCGLGAALALLAFLAMLLVVLWRRLRQERCPEIAAGFLAVLSIAVACNVIGSVFGWGAAWPAAIWGTAAAYAARPSRVG